MSKIAINKNFAKYFYKFVDNVFKPLTAQTTVSTYSGVTPTVTAISAMREVVVTKQSTLATLDKIVKYYNDSFSYNTLGWFTTDVNNTNPYTKNVLTNTYDFGKVVSIMSLTTSASASNPSSYPTSPFKLYTSTNGTDWMEIYSSDVNLSTVKIHNLNFLQI